MKSPRLLSLPLVLAIALPANLTARPARAEPAPAEKPAAPAEKSTASAEKSPAATEKPASSADPTKAAPAPPTTAEKTPAPAPAVTPAKPNKRGALDEVREAQRRFELAVTLYQEGDLRGALAEFRRAHEIFPSYKVLYNLALVSCELRDWAGALGYYRKYLDEGGAALAPDRRLQVEREMLELTQRVGRIEVDLGGQDGTLLVDEQPIAMLPVGGLIVNPGRHRLRLVTPGRTAQVQNTEVASGDRTLVQFARAERKKTPATTPSAATSANTLTKTKEAPSSLRSSTVNWSWTAAGILATAGIGSAIVAWDASQNLARERMKFPADPSAITSQESRTRTLSFAADALIGGAVIAAAVALYVTFTDPPDEEKPSATGPTKSRRTFAAAGTNLGLGWSF